MKVKDRNFNKVVKDVLELFYPRICPGCKQGLMQGENLICVNCLLDLPYTDVHDKKDNLVEERLAGKVPFQCRHSTLLLQQVE